MLKKITIFACFMIISISNIAQVWAADDEIIEWKLQVTHPFGNAGADVAFSWADAIEEMTNGRLKIDIKPPNTMCDTSQILQNLKRGTFDAAVTYGGFYTGMIPETDLEIGLPLGHQSWDEVWDAMWNRGLAEVIREAYSEQGMVWYPCAADNYYHFNTTFPVEGLEDFKGKKIRAAGVYGKYVQQLGASVTMVHPAEMYMAMKLGTIDGAIYGASGLQDIKLHEVVDYYVLPTAAQITLGFVISEKSLEKLPPELRNIVEVGSRYVIGDLSNQYITHTKQSLHKSVQDGDVEIVRLSENQLDEMRKLVKPVWDELAGKSDRMKKGVDILKQQMDDLGRPIE